MAMRLARTNDIWRSLYRQNERPVESVTVTYKDTCDGPDLCFTLNAPISLLCGENGVGKSRALRALQKALGGRLNSSDFRPKVGPLPPTVINVSAILYPVDVNGNIGERLEVTNSEDLSEALKDAAGEPKIYWFDPTVQIPYLLHVLRHDGCLSDLWEGVSPRKLAVSELEDVSALVGRTYDSVEFYEVNDYGNHDVVPYFRATCNGETYGAEEMGLGELSLLFLYWMLGRISCGAVLLMEEPETFIAPRSQRNLIDLVALETKEKKLFVVVTSHSGLITERVPNSHIDFVSRRGKEVTFLRSPPQHILADRLALAAPRSVMMLVEDEAGAMLAQALLEAGNSKFVAHCGIFVTGSDGEITSVLKLVQPRHAMITIVGVYDGDQRKSLPRGLDWPIMCLPGDVAPELLVKGFIQSNQVPLEDLFNRPKANIAAALSAVDGQNHHDWLTSLCAMLRLTQEELFRQVATGLQASAVDTVARFVSEFESKVIGR